MRKNPYTIYYKEFRVEVFFKLNSAVNFKYMENYEYNIFKCWLFWSIFWPTPTDQFSAAIRLFSCGELRRPYTKYFIGIVIVFNCPQKFSIWKNTRNFETQFIFSVFLEKVHWFASVVSYPIWFSTKRMYSKLTIVIVSLVLANIYCL